MDTLIQAEQLYRYYGQHCAVKDISFSLTKGEILGFLGPNGAGKSTTMQMICGNLAPSAGQIRINGVDLMERPREAKADLGYLPEIPPVYPDATVDEFLLFCGRLHRIHRKQILLSVNDAKERCGLMQVGPRLIGNLSKGFQQRVGIAQAILHTPSVIVLDEPTVGLDPIQIRDIRNLIRELGKEHGIILSTHILPEVQAICTRVQIIHKGKLVLNDSIDGLERRMEGSSMILMTRRDPPLDALTQIPGVDNVESLAENRFRIFFRKHRDPTERLAETVVSSGWGLLELAPERRSIEEIFLEITRPPKTDESRAR